MLAATGYDLLKEIHPSKAAGAAVAAAHVVMNSERWIVLVIGFVVSFIVALGVVEWFLMWVRKHGFVVFAVYRIVLALRYCCSAGDSWGSESSYAAVAAGNSRHRHLEGRRIKKESSRCRHRVTQDLW